MKKTALLLALAFCFVFTAISPARAQTPANDGGDPFAPYLSSVPETLRTIDEERQDGIILKRFVFSSRDGLNEVFAMTAEPAAEGTYPAILFLHGGGSCGEDMRGDVLKFARLGYVTMAIDLPGLCSPNKAPNSSGAWKALGNTEPPRLNVKGGAGSSTVVDAEVAGVEAFNYLAAHPKADSGHVGITGYSWGGYSTTMLSGLLGSKVKAAYAVYGCGFWELGGFWMEMIEALPESEREVWLRYIDSGRRAPGIEGAYFIEAPTNDNFFWPPAVSATLNAIRAKKNHVWAPNLDHRRLPTGQKMQQLWFDHHLKGEGAPFIEVGAAKGKRLSDGTVRITCKADVPAGVTIESATLYYSDAQDGWKGREWKPVPVQRSGRVGATLTAILPKATGVDYFIEVADDRGVVVSGDMYHN